MKEKSERENQDYDDDDEQMSGWGVVAQIREMEVHVRRIINKTYR